MYESYTQSRKWLLTINNPQDHGMTHDEIIDRAQKFNPDYVCLADNGKAKSSVEGTFKEFGVLPSVIQGKTQRMLAVDSFCTTERDSRHTGLTIPQALQASILNRI